MFGGLLTKLGLVSIVLCSDFMNVLFGSILNPSAEASAAPPPRELGAFSFLPKTFYDYKMFEAKMLFEFFSP